MEITTDRIIEELSRPEAYRHDPEAVQVVQTHISVVFLAGEQVFKIKKPVDFGFLDFTTLKKREHFCRRELDLNRRLSPDIYLDVVPIIEANGQLRVGGPETEGYPVVEFAVHMKRLDESRLLSNLLPAGKVDTGTIERIADRIAAFHRGCETSEEITGIGGIEGVRFNTEENFQQVEPFIGNTVSRETFDLVAEYTRTFIDVNRDMLAARERDGWIRDGHGDLHSQHICLTDSISIFDCIEFNERFRFADVLCDAAFLGMDLDRSGYRDLAGIFEDHYLSVMDLSQFRSLYNFYACYRAVVRGKVEGFRSADPSVPAAEAENAAENARSFFRLAADYARTLHPPTLFITCGAMGSGKSTLARAVANRFNVEVILSDVVRKELAGLDPSESREVPFGQDIYSSGFTLRTYQELHNRAAAVLTGGGSVVLDASYIDPGMRAEAVRTARSAGARALLIWINADRQTLLARLRQRRTGADVSDGREEILSQQLEALTPPGDEVPHDCILELDGRQSAAEWINLVNQAALATG